MLIHLQCLTMSLLYVVPKQLPSSTRKIRKFSFIRNLSGTGTERYYKGWRSSICLTLAENNLTVGMFYWARASFGSFSYNNGVWIDTYRALWKFIDNQHIAFLMLGSTVTSQPESFVNAAIRWVYGIWSVSLFCEHLFPEELKKCK